MVKDITGRDYKVGDYVFCATTGYCHYISTYIGKVCGVGEKTITVIKYEKPSWRSSNFAKATIQKPERDVIITEDIAREKSPELVNYDVKPKEYEHFDIMGVQYKLGDYVFIAQHCSTSSVRTYFGKVVKLNPETVSIARKAGCYHNTEIEKSVVMVPDRHMIVPEEIALRNEPLLRSV
ncbi:MAG: hypothetical protein PHN69_08355 [Candidatus Pacebacteria bacterium]|nr:hypothetical protein [Candidatus Paceibacterota bacterium]